MHLVSAWATRQRLVLGQQATGARAWPLRRVRDITSHYRADPAGARIFDCWSAAWSPWRAIATIAGTWPALRFRLRPLY